MEELFGSLIFSCPCDGHLVYGLAFLFAPAFLLFIPGVLLQRKLWTYQRTLDADEIHTRTRHYVKVLSIAFDLFLKASIAPISWLVISLLKQQYFTCAFFGPSLENKAFANTSDNCFKLESRSKELEENYRARSQITGLALLLIASLLVFIKICIYKCAFKGKRLQLLSLDYYRHVEAKEALKKFHLKAKEIAKQNAEKSIDFFFYGSSNKEVDARIEEVSKLVQKKYSTFFVIPPESPNSESPPAQVDAFEQLGQLVSEAPLAQVDAFEQLRQLVSEAPPPQVDAFEQLQQLVSEVDGVGEKRARCFEMKRLDCSGQSHNAHETPDHTHGEHTLPRVTVQDAFYL